MKFEQICTSLELAKKLHKKSFPTALFWWAIEGYADGVGGFIESGKKPYLVREYKGMGDNTEVWFISAPTASELGEALPKRVENFCLHCVKAVDHWIISYRDYEDANLFMEGSTRFDKSEANARAKMWLYLKENKLI